MSGVQSVDGGSIASLLVDAIAAQSDLLFTLAIAICGGIVALALQVALHNRGKEDKPLILRWSHLLWVAFVMEGLSAATGYLVRGALVASIPSLVSATYKAGVSLEYSEVAGLDTVQCFAQLQFYLFAAGVAVVLALICRNFTLLLKPPT